MKACSYLSFLLSLVVQCQMVLCSVGHHLFTDHPTVVSNYLDRYPNTMLSQHVVEAIVGLPSSQSPYRPMLNTLNIILHRPHTVLHDALFTNDCKLYRDLKTEFSTSHPHMGVIALLEQTPTFYLKECRVHLLCQRISNASTLEEIVQLVEGDLEIGNLTIHNAQILTDFILYEETPQNWSANVFEYLITVCGRLDARLRQ